MLETNRAIASPGLSAGLLFNAPLLLSLSAEEKWGQKVPLRAQHNKTKAAQRSIGQPLPSPGGMGKVLGVLGYQPSLALESASGGDPVHSGFTEKNGFIAHLQRTSQMPLTKDAPRPMATSNMFIGIARHRSHGVLGALEKRRGRG